MPNYFALAVPFFFGLIAVESRVSRRRKIRAYRFTDATTDLSCGIASQVFAAFFGATQLAIYAFVYEHRVLTLPRAWLAWPLAFVAVDFLYYWWHRLSHEVNLLWAAHVVHHQSEDYNLAVALRQAVLTSWTAIVFYLPLAVVGVPTLVFATIYAFSTLYQFWIHTELVGKFRGPFEWIMNLPQHHRVHHARNPKYLDKNYGATLVVWDRLFGTFAAEEEPCVYGITKPLSSFSPIWAQVHYFFDMAEMARVSKGFDRLRVLYKGPAWKPPGYSPPAKPLDAPKFDASAPKPTRRYVLVQYALLTIAMAAFMALSQKLAMNARVFAGALILLTTATLAALLEQKRWARSLEIGRLVGASLFFFFLYVSLR